MPPEAGGIVSSKRAGLSPKQLGALTRGGLVEVDDGTRRSVELYCEQDDAEVWSRIATTDGGEELTVLSFPEDVWEDVLDVLGVEDGRDKIKVGSMVWVQRG